MPIKHPGGMMSDDDFMSANTSAFWGTHSHGFPGPGRKDLEIMRSLGANTVRLYGNDPALDHSAFLDEAALLDRLSIELQEATRERDYARGAPRT